MLFHVSLSSVVSFFSRVYLAFAFAIFHRIHRIFFFFFSSRRLSISFRFFVPYVCQYGICRCRLRRQHHYAYYNAYKRSNNNNCNKNTELMLLLNPIFALVYASAFVLLTNSYLYQKAFIKNRKRDIHKNLFTKIVERNRQQQHSNYFERFFFPAVSVVDGEPELYRFNIVISCFDLFYVVHLNHKQIVTCSIGLKNASDSIVSFIVVVWDARIPHIIISHITVTKINYICLFCSLFLSAQIEVDKRTKLIEKKRQL